MQIKGFFHFQWEKAWLSVLNDKVLSFSPSSVCILFFKGDACYMFLWTEVEEESSLLIYIR